MTGSADAGTADSPRLSFLAVGERGPRVLLLHGFGSDRMTWVLNQTDLAAFTATLALDLPGHGGSAADVGDGTVAFFTAKVVAFIAARGMQPVHMIGHSLGGAIAIDLAHRHPDLVASLFLIAPLGLGRGIEPTFLSDFARMTTLEQAERVLRRLVLRPRLISRQVASRVLDHLAQPGARQSLRKVADGVLFAGTALAPAVAAVGRTQLPRTVVWGDADTINPIDEERLVAFRGSQFVVASAAHLPHMESWTRVNELLRSFYADL